jgi:hypothetical protein
MQSDEELQSAIDSVRSAVVEQATGVINSLAIHQDLFPESSRFVEYCNQLRRLLPQYAIPNWLKEACETFGAAYLRSPDNNQILCRFILSHFHRMQVPILIGEAAFDLDSVFDERRDKAGIPDLFDNLVEQLTQIIAQDVIEHRTVAEAIQRLKSVLAKNRRGSLAAILLSVNYGQFVLDSFRGVLSANKYTKPFIDTLTSEFAKAKDAVNTAKQSTEQETIRVLTHLKRLELFMEQFPEVEPVVAGYLPLRQRQVDI